MVYAAQPREGTETGKRIADYTPIPTPRFMQLNPARGRKLEAVLDVLDLVLVVYAAQPREGTETHPAYP